MRTVTTGRNVRYFVAHWRITIFLPISEEEKNNKLKTTFYALYGSNVLGKDTSEKNEPWMPRKNNC